MYICDVIMCMCGVAIGRWWIVGSSWSNKDTTSHDKCKLTFVFNNSSYVYFTVLISHTQY